MTEVVKASRYRILGNALSLTQFLLILICLASAISITASLASPLYEGGSHHMIHAGHKNAISHQFFRLAFPIFTLLAASILLFKMRTREVASIQPIDAVYKVLLPDEQKIVEILEEEGGSTTQKVLSRKTGLHRVKIHRNVHRLAEKNIVTIEPAGNTNTITLTEWLRNGENEE
jgi:uncharacterized membrane protein